MESKKNIWIINQYTGSPHYGMNYRSYYIAKELVKKGDCVTIFSGSYSHLFSSYPKTEGLFTTESIDGIDYIWVKTPQYHHSKSIGRVFNMLVFMVNLLFFNIFKMPKPDVIIISSLSLFPVINAYIWSKIFKIKFIFEVRDLWPLTLIEVGNTSKYHPLVLLLGLFESLGYKKASHVVSLLPNAKEYMTSRGMKADKFRYIPNGVNLEEVENYHDIPEDVKNQIPQNRFIIGYVGTLGIANALEYLLEAAKALQNHDKIHFVLVGKGGEKEKLLEFRDRHRLTNVTFIDPIPKVQVQGMLKLFDICYIGAYNHKIYKYGISANKLFDYMYSAKPVICAIEAGNGIVTEAECGVDIAAEDSNMIKKTILELYHSDKASLQTMGQKGKTYVVNHHSYSALGNAYSKIIEECRCR